MVLHAERPIVRVEHSSIRTIETRNMENLFGLWSGESGPGDESSATPTNHAHAVFARCSPAMEDGKRYENMAWRLWSRETFCCQPDHIVPRQWVFDPKLNNSTAELPELSSSVASDDSNLESAITTSRSDLSASRSDLRRHDSATSQARGKHLTPIGLEKFVNSIQEKKFIEPLSPLPPQLAPQKPVQDTTPRPTSPPATARRIPESSSSTVATTRGSDATSPPIGSEASTSTDMSQHSVVRGFEPGHVSTSFRSSTNLNPTPILKTSTILVNQPVSKAEPVKKRQPMFTLGGSSDEDNSSSLEAYSLAQRSSLAGHLRRAAPMRKTTSFKNEVLTRTIPDVTSESEEAMESAIESDSDEEYDESAIEEDDSEEEWEDDDENEESGPSSVNERPMFQRVDSKPNLTSHRSLLTTAFNESDRALDLQNAASRSTPAIRRSRTTTPNGPSTGNSPQEDSGLMMRQQATRPKAIAMTASNVHPPAMSPKTTRRLMLQSELSGSLRQNLLWERQQKNATTNAAMRRAMTVTDIKGLGAMHQTKSGETKTNNSFNDCFADGLHEYHQRGW